MKNIIYNFIILILFCPCSMWGQGKEYSFDERGISRQVLENYLDRSITMVYLLMPDKPEGRRVYSYHADDMRMVKDIGAKFIGRSIYRWGGESLLNKPEFWSKAKAFAGELHAYDPDIILQGCLFEIVTEEVNQVKIPDWVFKGYGLPVESRNFSYVDMLNDPERDSWARVIAKIREYARTHARRHWVLLDAHTPYGGMVRNGVSLLDFNSFPLRIKEIPSEPYKAELAVNHLDALYKKSKGCISPSGWKCEHLPYLVEFDNYGRGKEANVADLNSHFVWGWDEISWLSLQPEDYRNEWLTYAYHWIHRTDPNGHLEMPGCRMITCPNQTEGNYRANMRSEACPFGYSQEETIKELWNK